MIIIHLEARLAFRLLHNQLFLLELIVLLSLLIIVGCKLLVFVIYYRRQLVFLELTPPLLSLNSNFSTTQLFTIIGQFNERQSWLKRVLGCRYLISLEIVATQNEGIRYVAVIPKQDLTLFKQSLAVYLPEIRFKPIENYFLDGRRANVKSLRQTRHFAYPLSSVDRLDEHDPLSHITGALTKLDKDELIAIQLVISSTHLRAARNISNKILNGSNVWATLQPSYMRIGTFLYQLVFKPLEAFFLLVTLGLFRRSRFTQNSILAKQKLLESIYSKLTESLFYVDIRIAIAGNTGLHKEIRAQNIKSSMASLSNSNQNLGFKRQFIILRLNRIFSRRLPSLIPNILSSSELAVLYHFPYKNFRAEDVVRSLSKDLPPPISLKNSEFPNLVLGLNEYHGKTTSISLRVEERERHVYIVGGTGSGKTTMLLYSIEQDLRNNRGLCFIDPHGDAAQEILNHIPEGRINDVVYFNPDDLSHPIGLNLLELPQNLEGDDLVREKDLITETTISVFRKIFSKDESGGHRVEYVLRNTIQTALTVPDATIFTIFQLLNDSVYRRKVVAKLDDENLVSFWKNEIGKAGEYQRVKMSAGITAKVGRFLFSASTKRVMEQPRSSIDFENILNSGKILICNFSKGLLGEDASELFGLTVMAKIQIAALRRARLDQSMRRPFYLYVDEFQNFATTSFTQMLSEARKYQLCLTIAEQSTSQQKDRQITDVILANVGTIICFKSGNPNDEKMLLPLFSPFVSPGEIANLPNYHFYISLRAIHPLEPFSGITIPLSKPVAPNTNRRVKEASRINYTNPYKALPQINKPSASVLPSWAQEYRQIPERETKG